MNVKWRIIDTGAAPGALNMAVDEAILTEYIAGRVPPTIRFYAWQPPAVSLGYAQRAEEEIDFAACRRQGIDVVRRLTGGRAVLHDRELTYSVVVQADYPLLPPTITGSYRVLSGGLLAGLHLLGVEAHMVVPAAAYSHTGRRLATAACFDSPSHYEIAVDGKKLVGSAQVRQRGVILQHGSVLLALDVAKVAGIFRLSPQQQSALADTLARRATSLSDVLQRPVHYEEVRDALWQGFCTALQLHSEKSELTPAEKKLAAVLAREKYAQRAWTCRR